LEIFEFNMMNKKFLSLKTAKRFIMAPENWTEKVR